MSIFGIGKRPRISAILTDVLPFEAPLYFSSYGFYSYLLGERKCSVIEDVLAKYKNEFSEPYNYQIHINEVKKRDLSVVHPSSMISIAEFYDKNSSLIISSCARSIVSMRRPVGVAKKYYLKGLVDNIRKVRAGEAVESAYKEQKFASSYFCYSDYTLLGHYFESDEVLSYERKFPFHMYFDVSKCFYNIYTHSVSWAIHGKDNAKDNRDRSGFSREFDILMQRSNYNETNGIVVGPEVSRIFAEVIFQDIDIAVLSKCKVEGLTCGVDFVVRRYIDDIFVYAISERVVKSVYGHYSAVLSDYKLYVNESKSSELLRPPYITEVSLAKRDISQGFRGFSEDIGIFSSKSGKRISISSIARNKRLSSSLFPDARGFNYSRVSRKYIDFIRAAIGRRDAVSREGFSSYILSIVLAKADDVYIVSGDLSSGHLDGYRYIFSVLNVLARVAFYVYMQKPTVSALYGLSKIISRLKSCADVLGGTYSDVFKNYVIFELDCALDRLSHLPALSKVEIINILIVKKLSGGDVSELFLERHGLLPSSFDYRDLGYFEIVGIFFLLRESISERLSDALMNEVFRRINDSRNSMRKAENVLLFFDLICCPFLSKKNKCALFRVVSGKMYDSVSDSTINRWVKEVAAFGFFVDWESFDLDLLVQKKQLRTAY